MRIEVSQPNFLQQLPDSPGVYRFFDQDNALLYVGKALSLSRRVRSYFVKKEDISPRISLMVSKIVAIELTITDNETSALILENNLIKSLKPKYNIIFRDDKSYPYIHISRHKFPLLEYFRAKPHGLGEFYGPYPNARALKETIDLLHKLFKLRNCQDAFFAARTKPCMMYQIKRCSAPCVGNISASDYQVSVHLAEQFLSGKYTTIIENLSIQMYQLAGDLDFEAAAKIRDSIAFLKQMRDKQIVSNSNIPINADIVLYHHDEKIDIIYLVMIRNGLYTGDKSFKFDNKTKVEGLLEGFLENYYTTRRGCETIYLTHELSTEFIEYFSTRFGCVVSLKLDDRIHELTSMAKNNLNKLIENTRRDNTYDKGAEDLANLLKLDHNINRIECYDISHNHGADAVGAMSVYQDGVVDSKLYRKFNLDRAVNGNDILGLEIILRRRLFAKDLILPDVVIIDGGTTQFGAAKNIISELGFYDKIKLIGIFKGERRNPELDTILINEGFLIGFHEQRNIFRLVQYLRDEAHRFAITGHRRQQLAKMTVSLLEQRIPGVGRVKSRALMAYFGSAKAVAMASIDELQQVNGITRSVALTIHEFFHGRQN